MSLIFSEMDFEITSDVHKIDFPFVSVIIPVLNDPVSLQLCLQALDLQTYPKEKFEVLVVDNGSRDPLDDIVKAFKYVNLLSEKKASSYAARNRGILNSKGHVIAFTDADCLPDPSWIAKGVQQLLDNPGCGLVGGRIDFFYKSPENPTPTEIYDSIYYLRQEDHIKYGFAATANAFTFKKVFSDVGLFDESLQSGGDSEWGLRVLKYGYKLIYADDARILHPARFSYRELWSKEKRVTQGLYLRKKSEAGPYSAKELILNFFLKFRRLLRYWKRAVNSKSLSKYPLMRIVGAFFVSVFIFFQNQFETFILWIRDIHQQTSSNI